MLRTSIALFGLATSMAVAQVPLQIPYQGRLLTAGGAPVTGTGPLVLNILDAPAGNVVWGPQTFSNITLQEGHFSVILGEFDENAPTPRSLADAFQTDERWVTVTFQGNLLDTSRILSTPYCFSTLAATAGTIFPYAGTQVPPGFLLCDGSVVSAAAYPRLAAAIGTRWGNGGDADSDTFNLPGSSLSAVVPSAQFNIIKY